MGDERHIALRRLPSMRRFYARALWARKPAQRPGLVPRPLVVSLPRTAIEPRPLAAYRQLFGFAEPAVPWAYPQVWAGSMSAEVMLAPEFPFRLAGLIHLRSAFRALRPLAVGEPLALSARLAAHRVVKQGTEVDLVTEVCAGDQLVWRGTNTVLARTAARPRRRRGASPPTPIELPPGADAVEWSVPADTGRRYARVSGDYNPIHLFAVTAKLFGFERAIAHGLWSLARCLAQLELRAPAPPLGVEVEFRRPLVLPNRVLMVSRSAADGLSFALHSAARTETFLFGHVRPGELG